MIINTVVQSNLIPSGEFVKAIIDSGHSLNIAVVKCQDYRKFLFDSWNGLFYNFCGDYFIAIQNDLIIEKGCIEELIHCLASCDIALYSNMEKNFNLENPNCAFFACRLNILEDVKLQYKGENICCLCEWIKEAMWRGYVAKYATNKILKRCLPLGLNIP